MSKYDWICTLLLFSLLGACASVDVKEDYDNQYDFNQLKTFAWKTKGEKEHSLIGKRVMQIASTELQQRGYRQADADEADFLLDYDYRPRIELRSRGVTTSVGMGFGTGGVFSGLGVGLGNRGGVYESEALLIDVVERTTQNLLWRGVAQERLMESEAEETNENFSEVVKEIMKRFPPLN